MIMMSVISESLRQLLLRSLRSASPTLEPAILWSFSFCINGWNWFWIRHWCCVTGKAQHSQLHYLHSDYSCNLWLCGFRVFSAFLVWVCLFVCFSHRTGSESIKGRLPGLFVLPCSGQLQTQSEWHLFLLLSSGLWATKWRNRPAEISAFVSRSFWASDKREGKGQIWQTEQNISLSAFTSYFLLLPKSMSSYSLVRIYRGFF